MQANKVMGPDSPGKPDEVDMIVVGGGITGCGIARDAVLRGLRVVLLEKNDFGSGTSSRSSRLIHGGVRYLEHGYLHLVFEASAERRRLLRLAPHLVRPLKFTWPVYRGARIRLWKLAAGLTLYDMLALFRNVGRHRVLSAGWMKRDQPAVLADGLVGGATYYDAATDDSRLTLAVAMDARARGATLLNHAKVEGLIIEHGMARGVEARDVLTGQPMSFRAPMIVNATGPWSDAFRALEGVAPGSRVHGSKGVHIAVPRGRIGNRGAFTLLSPKDGRVMFVLPGEAQTIIGTTDTFTSSSPDDVRANEADVAYLLEAANHFFPRANLHRGDVIAAWAGIRPLMASSDENPGSASREHAIAVTAAGVVTITGGKLTTFRIMAEQTVDRALRHAGLPFVPGRTADMPIGWDFPRPKRDVAALQLGIAAALRERNDERVPRMVIRYGARWRDALAAIDRSDGDAERIHPEHTYRFGDLRFACEHESARTLGDLLIRRTHLAFERQDHAIALAPRVAEYVAPILGWSAQDIAEHMARYRDEVENIFRVLSS
jgi:glycerol-3-phosphate dehydrogenase